MVLLLLVVAFAPGVISVVLALLLSQMVVLGQSVQSRKSRHLFKDISILVGLNKIQTLHFSNIKSFQQMANP